MSPRRPPLIVALAALLCFVLQAAPPAGADGDPASDVLLGQNVYYPYSPTVANALQSKLNAETAAAAKAHFPIKVALIVSPIDLGVIPELFGKPQKYAAYLDQEISFFSHAQPLLVVMAAGYGTKGIPPAAQAAVATLRRPAGGSANDLAQAAVTAVAKLAKAAGHPLNGESGNPGGGGNRAVLVVVLALAAIATATALLVLRHRQAAARRS